MVRQETIEISEQRTAQFCMIFCTRGRLMYERLWQTALADHCISKPLKNLSWSCWRLIWRQNCFDMYHWALGRSENFILTSLKFKVAPYPKIVSLDTLIPKTIRNRKRDCAWSCARGINTTWENLQIEKHKSGRRSFRSPDWFVLFDLQIFSGGVYPPSATSRTISVSISNSFWY